MPLRKEWHATGGRTILELARHVPVFGTGQVLAVSRGPELTWAHQDYTRISQVQRT